MGRKGDHFARRKEGRFIGRDNKALSLLSRAPRPRDRGRKGLTTSDGRGLAALGCSLPADAVSDDGGMPAKRVEVGVRGIYLFSTCKCIG